MSIDRPRSSPPPAAPSINQLGSSVVISGATIVAGAQDHAVAANAKQGAAYEWVNPTPTSTTTAVTQDVELTASDGATAIERLSSSTDELTRV
jgi:hypothetical protein